MNYYNEFDPDAATQIRGLIAAGLIPDGVVDERSIEDIAPNELLGYSQLHFFAGVAGWPHALDLAGWPRGVPCITGSCPCQPFSQAGKGDGFDDERHLWPAFWHIIRELKRLGHPAARVVLGEQVASPDALVWLDLVFDDLESEGYTVWAEDSCSASVGAPHIRQRIYWCGVGQADADNARLEGWFGGSGGAAQCASGPRGMADGLGHPNGERQNPLGGISARTLPEPAGGCVVSGLANGSISGRREERSDGGRGGVGNDAQGVATGFEHGGSDCGMADADPRGCGQAGCDASGNRAQGGGRTGNRTGDDCEDDIAAWLGWLAESNGDGPEPWRTAAEAARHRGSVVADGGASWPGPLHGFWRDADWLFCRDGKWRPIGAGLEPLADGLPRSMGALGPELSELARVAGLSQQSLAEAKRYRVRQLKGYGNAINPWQAAEFVRAVMAEQWGGQVERARLAA